MKEITACSLSQKGAPVLACGPWLGPETPWPPGRPEPSVGKGPRLNLVAPVPPRPHPPGELNAIGADQVESFYAHFLAFSRSMHLSPVLRRLSSPLRQQLLDCFRTNCKVFLH